MTMEWREDLIPARITSTPEQATDLTTSGQWRHEWQEQSPSNDGTYTPYAGCRFGTLSGATYATELNGGPAASGTIVWLRRKTDLAGMPVYEFILGGGDGIDCVSPLLEQMASGTVPYCTGSGLLEELIIGASGTYPASIGSGLLQFATPLWRSGSIGSGAVNTNAIASGAVTYTKIAQNNIISGHLDVTDGLRPAFGFGSGGLYISTIARASIGFTNLVNDSVVGTRGSGVFGDSNVASGGLGSFDFAADGILSGHLASGSVAHRNLGSGIIEWHNLASGSVLSGAVASGQIGSFHLATNSVTSGRIGSGAVLANTLVGTAIEAYLSGNQVISGNVANIINLGIEVQDTLSEYDPTAFRFTPTNNGSYFVDFRASLTGVNRCVVGVHDSGGTEIKRIWDANNTIGGGSLALVTLSGGTGYTFRVFPVTNSDTVAGGVFLTSVQIRRHYP